jgi:hypothetical protein
MRVKTGISEVPKQQEAEKRSFDWGGALTSVGGSLLGMIGQNARARKQHNRQKELMNIQLGNQKQLNQQGHDLQYDMWNKTNYGAQKEHMLEAGLNPALMYGMSGGGGATTGSQSGGSAQGGNASAPMDLGNALQMGLIKSQIELAKSQAVKNTAEADKIKGVDTESGKQGIKESEQRIANLTEEQTKKIQETTNLKTIDQANKLKIELDKQIKNRQDKGMIKGDTIGNMLEAVGLDPVNSKDDQMAVRMMLGSWFGVKMASDIMGAVMKSKNLMR